MTIQATRDRDAIKEIASIATNKTAFRFVALLTEYFQPHEIVLILRAAVTSGLWLATEKGGGT